MSLISSAIPNLIGGVSQQPRNLRLPSQAEEQVNGLSTPIAGLAKRPPAKYLGLLGGGDPYSDPENQDFNPYYSFIEYGPEEAYVVQIGNKVIRVFDLITGEEQPVFVEASLDYLDTIPSRDNYRTVTVEDYTFILNRQKTTQLVTNATTSPLSLDALLWVRQGVYGETYKVELNGTLVASYTTPDGTELSHVNDVQPTAIASELKRQIENFSGTAVGVNVTQEGASLRLRADGKTFPVKVSTLLEDSLRAFSGTVQRFSDLPAKAVEGFKIKVAGIPDGNEGAYWIEYQTNETGQGVWQEIAEPNSPTQINADTMPHALVRSEGVFYFRTVEWDEKRAGTSEDIFKPSFINKPISDITFFKNRLGLICSGTVVFSRASEYFNFWRETGTALLDSDPIDVEGTHMDFGDLEWAAIFHQDLYVFSHKAQFRVEGAELFTPKTVSIVKTAAFPMDTRVSPMGVGKRIFFASHRGDYSSIREYVIPPDDMVHDAPEVTGHVPAYIPRGVFCMAASAHEDILLAISEETPGSIYVYNFKESGGEQVQSAWHRWDVGPEGTHLWNMGVVNDKLYLVASVSGPENRLMLLEMELSPLFAKVSEEVPVCLDFLVKWGPGEDIEPFYDDMNERTVILLPYVLEEAPMVVITSDDPESPGMYEIDCEVSLDKRRVFLDGDFSSAKGQIGFQYTFRYVFTPPAVRPDGYMGGAQATSSGRLQLRTMSLTFEDTGRYCFTVTPRGRQSRTVEYSGPPLGSYKGNVAQPLVSYGSRRFPIRASAEDIHLEISSAFWTPCHFTGAEWEGVYVSRSRRV